MDTRLLLDAPASATSRIQIARLGSFKHGKYGEFEITAEDVKDWQGNLAQLPGGRALIDLDHRADRSPRNTEAAGWITSVELADGVPMADVEWTPVGREAIESRRYLFFSPSYGKHTNEAGEEFANTLVGGALTNKPFLTKMKTVSLAAPERLQAAVELDRDEAEEIRTLGVSQAERDLAVKEKNALPDGSYPIRNTGQLHAAAHLAATGHGNVAGARKLIKRRAKELGVDLSTLPGFADGDGDADSRQSMAQITENLLKLLDLTDEADDAAVEAAVTALAEKAAPTKSLETEVAAKDAKITTLEGQMSELRQFADRITAENTERAFNEVFGTAVREGRTTAAQRENFRRFYELDADGTTKLLAESPQLVRMSASGWDNASQNPEAAELPANVGDKPGQVDPYSYQLDQRVRAHIAASERLSLEADYGRVANDFITGRLG